MARSGTSSRKASVGFLDRGEPGHESDARLDERGGQGRLARDGPRPTTAIWVVAGASAASARTMSQPIPKAGAWPEVGREAQLERL